ncbi:hypothetical protein PENTCL1PPCAC_16101, partial [Pristionchus entomophagus]
QGCFDYPLETLKLGCRKNYAGSVLDSDLCNEEASNKIEDLPIVRNCRDDLSGDGSTDSGKTCTANFCANTRQSNVRSHSVSIQSFDIFASTYSAIIPAGICITYQLWEQHYDEMFIGGIRKCRGHACFLLHAKDREDVRPFSIQLTQNLIYISGTQRILDWTFYICDRSMCNA